MPCTEISTVCTTDLSSLHSYKNYRVKIILLLEKTPSIFIRKFTAFVYDWLRQTFLLLFQQDATLHSLFYLETALHVSGWYHHPSSETQTTVSTTSGICHTVTAICRFRGRAGTGLSVLPR